MPIRPRFPLYIVSKGRWESRLTHRALKAMDVDHFLVIERSEFDSYAEVIDPLTLVVLDPAYQRDYDTFDDLGDTKSKLRVGSRYRGGPSLSLGDGRQH